MPATPRLALATRISADLIAAEGRNLVAVGVYGSVARGKERRYSDIDMLVIVRRKRARIRPAFRERFLVTILQLTPEEAREEVMGSRPDLNDALGGWRSMRPLYDPTDLLAQLKSRAQRPTKSQFREAARRALLETYEDYGKLLNAIQAKDVDEAREMAIWFTGAAMGTLHNLEAHVLATGRQAFIELRMYGGVGERICELRYHAHPLPRTSQLARSIWAELLERARRRDITVGALH